MNPTNLISIALGGIIGCGFAWLQLQALRRNELLEKRQALTSLLKRLPGSGARVALLLMALVLVQVLVPRVNQWWFTGGLVVTYSLPFVWRLFQWLSRKLDQA
jgi:hypothetical protein